MLHDFGIELQNDATVTLKMIFLTVLNDES